MNIFKKKPKKQNINEDIEIVDLDSDKVVNTLEEKKELRTAILIGVIILIFILLLPKLVSIFSKDSIFSYTDKVNEVVNSETIDGMLEIGKEKGYITAKNVKFYNPRKTTDNQISITYLPLTGIKNIDDLNVYIEIYNSNKEIVSRVKFSNIDKLERKVQGNYKIDINETIYKEAKYFKATIIKASEFDKINDTLTCKYSFTHNNIKVDYERKYNFTKSGLLSYSINKTITKLDETSLDNTTLEEYKKLFTTENENLKKTNIEDITLTDSSINYTVNLSTLKLGKSSYKKIYEQGSIKRQIELSEAKMNWMCE